MESASAAALVARLSDVMPADRFRLARRLERLKTAPDTRELARVAEAIDASAARRADRHARPVPLAWDGELPVVAKRREIADAIAHHQITIVCGETGSGKSTQLPKICLELGRGRDGLIGHTQPRRIAARSVADRIAEELTTPLGDLVGYQIRFGGQVGPGTLVKLMTDGILLAETRTDRFLSQYDTLIIDEAHERSLNIDFLLGYLVRILPRRPDLKLIITSATIDPERFRDHFAATGQEVPILFVSGRTYPVEVRYRPPGGLGETLEARAGQADRDEGRPDGRSEGRPDGKIDERRRGGPRGPIRGGGGASDDGTSDNDLLDALADAVDECLADGSGDILAFLPTERHIREAVLHLEGRATAGSTRLRGVEILPLYGRLSQADQQRVFHPGGRRRLVLSTNVAESSVTVPRITYVIDDGRARISRYATAGGVQRLPIEPISQASADQRKGRCGRIGPGVCLRLYAEEDYLARPEFTEPEILRTNLASVILRLKDHNLGEAEEFPFLDPPRANAIRDGLNSLYELTAIDAAGALTATGRKLASMPVDPRIGRMILAGDREGCLDEILVVAAALEIQDPRDRPADKQAAADAAHSLFKDETSDFLSLLLLWETYQGRREALSKSQLRKWCERHFLSFNRLREWEDLHRELRDLARREKLHFRSGRDEPAAIHRALLSGLLSNIALKGEAHEYTGAQGQRVVIWPGSTLFDKKPPWVMASEIVETSRRYLRTLGEIDPAWCERLAEHLVTKTYSEPYYSPRTGQVMASEKVSLFGLPIVVGRRVRYGKIDPVASRQVFIRQALVEGRLGAGYGFLTHNQNLVAEVETLQNKLRRGDLLLGESALYDFYEKHLPSGVYDSRRLDNFLHGKKEAGGDVLKMSYDDIALPVENSPPAAAYPDQIDGPKIRLPLSYRFAPGDTSDGVTITVPQETLPSLDARRLTWVVPGLLTEKVTALIKSLPKSLRRHFVPAPETAARVSGRLPFGEADLLVHLARELSRISGETVTARDFDLTQLPPHLAMNVRVTDADGKQVAESRDVDDLRRRLGLAGEAAPWTVTDADWTKPRLTEWAFDRVPAEVAVARGSVTLPAYPALVDEGETVALRLVDDPRRADRVSRSGLARLVTLARRRALRSQVANLPSRERMIAWAAALPPGDRFDERATDLIAHRAVDLALSDRGVPPISVMFVDDPPTKPGERAGAGRERDRTERDGPAFAELAGRLTLGGGAVGTLRSRPVAVAATPATAPPTQDPEPTPPPRKPVLPTDRKDFDRFLAEVTAAIPAATADVATLLPALLERHHETRKAVSELDSPNFASARTDLRAQLAGLVSPGFVRETPWAALTEYPRYFDAMARRIDKLRHGGAERDASLREDLAVWTDRLAERTADHATRAIYDPAVETLRWMIEEYRVSLFAQELGTKSPISIKRLERQWSRVV